MIAPSALRKLAQGPSLEELDKKIQAGEYQYHNFGSCFVITHIAENKHERVLEVVVLFGSGFLEKREEVTKTLEDFGKEHGCKAVEAPKARLGLESAMKPFGWKRKKVILRKEIHG